MMTNEFINDLGTSDYESWLLVQEAHLKNAYNESVEGCGFNKQSGYVYIALENGIQIASSIVSIMRHNKYVLPMTISKLVGNKGIVRAKVRETASKMVF